MNHAKGKPLTSGEKRLLISVKQYLDRNKLEFGSSDSAAQMTSDALGVGLSTVTRVLAQYHKDPDSIHAPPQIRGRPVYSIESSNQEAVRA